MENHADGQRYLDSVVFVLNLPARLSPPALWWSPSIQLVRRNPNCQAVTLSQNCFVLGPVSDLYLPLTCLAWLRLKAVIGSSQLRRSTFRSSVSAIASVTVFPSICATLHAAMSSLTAALPRGQLEHTKVLSPFRHCVPGTRTSEDFASLTSCEPLNAHS